MHNDDTSLPTEDPNPSGLCMCGCGKRTRVYLYDHAHRGYRAGHHSRFLHGHHLRGEREKREPISGVYAIRHTTTGRCYIGSSKDTHTRWLTHQSELSRGVHGNRSLQADWKACGREAFSFEVLETAPAERLKQIEERWIQEYAGRRYNVREKANQSTGGESAGNDVDPIVLPNGKTIYTTKAAAAELELSPSRVAALATQMGLGRRVVGRDIWLSYDDVEAIRNRPRRWGNK